MALRRRFWDATVLAAAITAGLGGLSAGVGSWIDFRKTQIEIEHERNKERCDSANQYLGDESPNPDIPKDVRVKLASESAAIVFECRKRF